MKFMRKNGGFTLVELIVVIAILAILAGVAVPAYSGYINKANEAADNQLLGAVNTAFAAACIENNVSSNDVKSAGISIVDRKVDVSSVWAKTETKTLDMSGFATYYAGNEGATFKVFTALVFDGKLHCFTKMSERMSNLLDILTGGSYNDAIAAVQGSAFHTMGYNVLAGKIDNASDLLAGFYGSEDSGFHKLLESDENYDVLNSFLPEDEDEADAVYQEIFDAKLAALKEDPRYNGMTKKQLENMAHGQIMSNTAILTAAKNSETAITGEFIKALEDGNAVSLLTGATDGGAASADTIAQAAFAYAMYTSYQQYSGNEVTEDVDITDVYNTLNTEGFKNYMKKDSADDQKGYFGAMELISGSAENADNDLAQDILLNGFNSDELVALIQGATK